MKLACQIGLLLASTVLVQGQPLARPVNDTGQIDCYDETSSATGTVGVDPTPEGAGFEAQDCTFGAAAADAVGVQRKIGASSVPGRDYTKIANDGSELPPSAMRGNSATDWGCTRDNVTGLIWEVRSADGFRSSAHRYAWANTTPDSAGTCSGITPCNSDTYASVLNAFTLCGRSDWRLPTPVELGDLIAYQASLAAGDPNLIDPTYFPDQTSLQAGDGFWTNATASRLLPGAQPGDPPVLDASLAWAVDFVNGGYLTLGKSGERSLRLVSGTAAALTNRFSRTDKGGGQFTTVDSVSGLEWKSCMQGRSGSDCSGTDASLSWSAALAAARTETFAGHSDWRLPTITELASIRDFATSDAATLDAMAFPDAGLGLGVYWSSTSDPGLPASGLTHQFRLQSANGGAAKSTQASVRLVRGGRFLNAYARNADSTPDGFAFTGKSATGGTLVESDPITVSGLGGPASLRASGAVQSAYAINDGPWTTLAGAVNNGDTVKVRHLSAASAGATAVTTLAVGTGSATFTSTTTAGPPGAPTSVLAIRLNAGAALTFTAPASDGGSAITGYTATSIPAGGISSCQAPPATSCNVTGLTNGQTYSFTVTAINAAGSGSASAASNLVVPAGPPGAPGNLGLVSGATTLVVNFGAAPANGEPITSYTATLTPSEGAISCDPVPATVCRASSLRPNTAYSVVVRATNAVGTGPSSAPANGSTTAAAPTIGLVGSPRTEYPMNHHYGWFRFSRKPDITLVIDDADTALANLSVSVTSSNPSLLPANVDAAGNGIYLEQQKDAQNQPTNRWIASLRPLPDRDGNTTLSFTVSDGALTSSVALPIVITRTNAVPTARLSTNSIRLAADAQPGTVTVSDFLVSTSPGTGEEVAQLVTNFGFAFLDAQGNHPDQATFSPSINLFSRELRFTLPANTAGISLFVWPIDNGPGSTQTCTGPAVIPYAVLKSFEMYVKGLNTGDAPEYVTDVSFSGPCGAVRQLPLVRMGETAAQLRVARPVGLALPTAKGTGPVRIAYDVAVLNTGGADITGAELRVPRPPGTGAVTWRCTENASACKTPSGAGDVATRFDLAIDAFLVVEISVELPDILESVPLAPRILFAEGVEGIVFGNGVERRHVFSNALIMTNGFEGARP